MKCFCALIFLCICAHAGLGGGDMWHLLSRCCRQTGVTFYFSFTLARTATRPPRRRSRSLPHYLRLISLAPSSLFPGEVTVIPAASSCKLRPLFWRNVTTPGYR